MIPVAGPLTPAVGACRVALVTDFGSALYVGQMRLRLASMLPATPLVDLIHDLPPFRPDCAAYLLPALLRDLPEATLYICVVDPGVGSRRGVVCVEADGSWLLGPDNGLLARVARRAGQHRVWRLDWRPDWMSDSFHGRDLFVPLAGRLLGGDEVAAEALACDRLVGADWPDEHQGIIYRDRFGNLMTGLRAAGVAREARIAAGWQQLTYARTFSEAPLGAAFWYENALGLVELAVNQGAASQVLGLDVGDPVRLLSGR